MKQEKTRGLLRYQKAIPDVVKKIRTMIFKTDPATKRDIANLLELNRGSINHVIKHIIKCRVKKKPKVHQHTQATVEKRRERSWRLNLILNARKSRNYVITDFALFYLCGNYGKIRVHYV